MSIFGQYKGGAALAVAALAVESLDTQVNTAPAASVDPLQALDPEFAAERQAADDNQEADLDQGAETNTDVELPEGDFGEPAKVTGTDDVKVDADNTEVTFDNELGDDDVDADDADDLDRELDTDTTEIEMLAQEISQLTDAGIAIESYGMGPSTVAVMQITGLLSGTALESLGLESVQASKPADAEAQMALEALGEKIKDKAAAFAAKIVSVVKSGGEKILAIVSALWNKLTGIINVLTSKAWDVTKSAAATVKAHPYKTIAAVVTAIGVVAGIVVACGGAPVMGAKLDVVKNFMTKLASDIGKIKFPGAQIKAGLNEAGTKITLTATKVSGAAANAASTATTAAKSAAGTVASAASKAGAATKVAASSAKDVANTAIASAQSGGLKALGWTQQSVKAIESQLGRAWTQLKGGWGTFASRGTKIASGAGTVFNEAYLKPVTAGGMAVSSSFASTAAKMGAGAKVTTGAALVGAQLGAGAIASMIIGLVGVMIKLIHLVVVGGFRIIMATFRALVPQTRTA